MNEQSGTRRFFVMHLEETQRPSPASAFEIQILDVDGRATACGYVGDLDTSLEVDGEPVPLAVIEAARRQAIGQGDYVDDNGNSLSPF